MADPTLTDQLLITLGDGGGPEVFAHPCGANARNVTFTNNLGEEVTLDCADPLGTAAAIQRWVESQDTTISISGRVARESWDTWRAWMDDATPKNIRVEVDNLLANGGGYWELPAYLQQFEMGAEGKGTMSFTASIVGAGRRVWTDAV